MATNDIAPPENTLELLERVAAAWEALGDSIAGLSSDQLAQPGPQGWAVKDHLAHVAVWEQATTAVVQRRPQASAFGLEPAELARFRDDGVDALNELVYQRHRELSVDDVLELSRQAHAALLGALRDLEDADLQKPMAAFGADPGDQRPLLEKIAGDTYAHYADHQAWIADLLAALA